MASKDFLNPYTRRGFLRQAARAGVGLSAAAILRDLRLIGTASAQSTLNDLSGYKALCCIFLEGGNDSDNMIVATGSEWSNYNTIRSGIAIPSGSLLSITPGNSDGHSYGLHPSMGLAGNGIKKLFDEGKAAAVFNVGPLLAPLTKAEYESGSVAVPPQLFSHSDQATHWQTSLPDRPATSGWGGRIADMMLDGIPAVNRGKISLSTSLAGTNTFQTGSNINQYGVSIRGAVTPGVLPVSGEWTGGWHQALQNINDIDTGSTNLQRSAYAGVVSNSMANGALVNAAIAATKGSDEGGSWVWNAPFPDTPLGNQLKMVARMIQARGPGQLDMKRQTFFTQAAGFDTHNQQVKAGSTTTGNHAELLEEVSGAVYAFQRAMEQLGVEEEVVTFTASDFGRTFRSNGLGSDHGWGGHHFVIGGKGRGSGVAPDHSSAGIVKGRWTYGTLPTLSLGSNDDSGGGRWIPTISVDEYSATLAKWFGVSNSDLDTVFPNLRRFVSRDLGFLRT